jgi:hypothetical protein
VAVRYKNRKTGHVVTYAQPIPRLERSKDFERVDDKPAEKKTSDKS